MNAGLDKHRDEGEQLSRSNLHNNIIVRWPSYFVGEGLRPLYCETAVFPNSANRSAAFGTGLHGKRTTTETRIVIPVGTTPKPPVNGTTCVTQWVHFQQSILMRFGSI